jgi:hypothetical protein
VRFSVTVSGSVSEYLREQRRAGALATTRAMAQVGAAVKANWRQQVVGAGLGNRLGNTIRSNVYPENGASFDAAARVKTNAPKIIDAFEKGATIRAQNGFWLAIPLPAAGKSGRNGKITPGEWERRKGRRLTFIYRKNRTALLIDDGTVKTGARTLGRDGFSRAARGFRGRVIPIFYLTPQVKLRKRLTLFPAAQRIGASLGARIISNWR